MKNDDYYDYLTSHSSEWMPSNIYHDEYCAKKKEQEGKEKNQAPSTKKEKRPSRLGLLFHSIVFEGIFHAKYSEYVDWFVSHDEGSNYVVRATWIRLLSIILIPVAYFALDNFGNFCGNLFDATDNIAFIWLLLAVVFITVAIIFGLWKAATIEFKIIASAKEKAKAIRFEKNKTTMQQ